MTQLKAVIAGVAVLLIADAAQAATNPWFGIWKLRLKDRSEKPETLVYSDAGNGAMRMESVEEKSVIVTRFDGTAAANGSGPQTLAVKALSSNSYAWTFSVAGKPLIQGVNTLAADLKTFREVSWPVPKPSDTVTLVYERQ